MSGRGAGAAVLFGKGSGDSLTDPVDLADAVASGKGFLIDGPAGVYSNGDGLKDIAGAGDVDGDGRADILVGDGASDPLGRTDAGSAWVVFGRPGPAFVDLSRAGYDALRLAGPEAGAKLGDAVAGLGLADADTRADLLVGAAEATALGRAGAGAALQLPGAALPRPVPPGTMPPGPGRWRAHGPRAAARAERDRRPDRSHALARRAQRAPLPGRRPADRHGRGDEAPAPAAGHDDPLDAVGGRGDDLHGRAAHPRPARGRALRRPDREEPGAAGVHPRDPHGRAAPRGEGGRQPPGVHGADRPPGAEARGLPADGARDGRRGQRLAPADRDLHGRALSAASRATGTSRARAPTCAAASPAAGTAAIVCSASAVIVRLGFTPGLAGSAEPSVISRFS